MRLLIVASLLVCTSCLSSPAYDPRPPYSKPDVGSMPCRVDEIISTFSDVSGSYEVCTPVGCAGAETCATPATGNATVECYMPGGVTQCRLRCSGVGALCPDGMVCVASADSNLSACAYLVSADGGI